MNRRQTSLAMGNTVGEHGRRRHDTHRFSTGKGTCSAVSRSINRHTQAFLSAFLHLLFAKTARSASVLDRQESRARVAK